jgi:hypothetical protein
MRKIIFVAIGEISEDPETLQLHGSHVLVEVRLCKKLAKNGENVGLQDIRHRGLLN